MCSKGFPSDVKPPTTAPRQPGEGLSIGSPKNVQSSIRYPNGLGVLDPKLVSDDFGRVERDIKELFHDLEGHLCRHFGEAAE